MKTFKTLVFDIKRFAIHDGQGIRTTVFFKGCPLKCKWCQNPEGLSTIRNPIYIKSKCIHCRLCEKYGEYGQMIYHDNHPMFIDDWKGGYDNLIRVCPSTAIRYDSEYYDLDSLFERIKDDEVFFKHGGGVTFSGGEPLMQGDFLIEILKRCKEAGIHTTIESSWYASGDYVKKVLPYLDTIYADIKVLDPLLHSAYTGVDNKIILDNISYMLSKEEYRDKVIIRTPLIPTMTATDTNILDISTYIYQLYQDVHYELLNYNPLASSKYELIEGLEYGVSAHYKMYDQKEMNHFYDVATKAGIKHLVIE